jgi:MHS family proline/betaine transporter-like MFS transporter
VAIFGGTTPFIVAALIGATGDDMMPAYYLMATSAIGAIAIYFLKESAQRPLPGSMPSVDTQAEAKEIVATQDENPLIDLVEMDMPFTTATADSTAGQTAARETDMVPAKA